MNTTFRTAATILVGLVMVFGAAFAALATATPADAAAEPTTATTSQSAPIVAMDLSVSGVGGNIG